MRSLALLRGNVGGKNKVDMATLRETFTRTGAGDVLAYIHSGNVISDDERPHRELANVLEGAIENDFGLRLEVPSSGEPMPTSSPEAGQGVWSAMTSAAPSPCATATQSASRLS